MAQASFYPDNPANVPEDFTAPSSQFRTQTSLVMFSLALFFLLYFGMILVCIAYPLWALWFFLFSNVGGAGALVFRFVALLPVPVCGILFIYLAKNLIKLEFAQKPSLIELLPDEHPKLFAFIEQTCSDVGADTPKHVYVDYSVNAAAILETTSFFHLFLPTRRSLLIGLGLVNAINLTEFKALLAHEFGHFSQSTMKVGAYSHVARLILYHVINSDDLFDRFIIGWSRLHILLAWPAWIVRGVNWLIRRGLGLLHFAIFFFDRGLSRQEEFNADLIAVSVTGSDAPVHLLYRSYFADACLELVAHDLNVAMSHHLYSRDVFFHQSAAAKILRARHKNPKLGEPPPLPTDPNATTQVFEEYDDKMAQMWLTHPSSFDREQNAKAHYIRSRFDERSPWILFEDRDELRERVTVRFYRFFFKLPRDVILADPLEVQGFIDDEHADRTYAPKYQGLYDNRNLFLKEKIKQLAQEGADRPWTITELAETHRTLYNAEVKHRAQLYYKRIEEFHLLNSVDNGWHSPKNDELDFRGDVYDPEDARRLLKKVEKELEKDKVWLEALDHRVFMTYFQMALHIDQEVAEELYLRYEFHLELQSIWYELQSNERPLSAALGFLQSQEGDQLESHHFRELLDIFRDAHRSMKEMLKQSKEMTLPTLKNLPAGHSLRPFLLEKRLLDGLSRYERSLSTRWIMKMVGQFREMKDKVDRIHFKSLAGILALQERIGDECVGRWNKLPMVQSVN